MSLLHCDVRLSRIDLDILKFCRSVGRSRTKKLSASGRLRPPDSPPGALPLDPAGGSAPDPRYRLALHALAMVAATACSPNFQTLPTLMRGRPQSVARAYVLSVAAEFLRSSSAMPLPLLLPLYRQSRHRQASPWLVSVACLAQ